MNSGIEISPEIITEYKQCAMKGKSRYVIYTPSDDGTAIEIKEIGDMDKTFDDMKNSIEPSTSCWAVCHLQWINGERKMSKIILIAFAPDGCADNGKKFIVAANKGMLV